MARIAIVSIGSRGDLFPMLGIGRTLRFLGHDVTVFEHGEYEADVVRAGLKFTTLGAGSACQETFERSRGTAQLLAGMIRRVILPNLRDWVDRICSDGPFDAVVAHHFQFAAQLAADLLGIPFISVAGSDIADLYYPPRSLSPDRMKQQHELSVIDRVGTRPLNAIRGQLGLAERPYASTIGTLSASGVVIVCPGPFLPPTDAWPSHFRVAGYPWYEGSDKFEVPKAVLAFVEREDLGPLIVCSLGDAWAKTYPRTCVNLGEVAERRGCRVLYLLCRGSIEVSSERTMAASFVPMSKVLHKASLFIHSAGRGSLVNGLRMAVPALLIPQWIDCYENARKAELLGAGRVVPRDLDVDQLDAEVAAIIESDAYFERTAAIARAIAEDPDPGLVVDDLISAATKPARHVTEAT